MLDLSRLSPAQQQVALAPEGAVLVVAGPGSGKTTALVARVAMLVTTRSLPPGRVLVLTFTSAAARELRTRLIGLLGRRGAAVDVCTFHSFGLRLVRRWRIQLGLGNRPLAVYGADEARRLLREAAARCDPARRRRTGGAPEPIRQLATRIERYRLSQPPAVTTGERQSACPGVADCQVAALAKEYEDLLRSRQAVDFTAMLAWPLQLFEQHPRVLHGQQRAYRVLLCDEFQDVCPAQYALVRRLAATHGNVTAVGDPRQTIYGWRGADAALLLAFQRDFPGAQLLTLDQNFRSTRRIVAFANALGAPLEHLEYRRSLWTDNEDGSAVVVHAARDEAAEAAFVAEEIVRLWEGGQVAQLGEVAVLYRTNRQADPFALALRSRGLPYLVWGGGDLFARRELRDLVAYLRLAVNPHDHAALARIVDTPPRGLAALARHLRAEPATTDELPALARQHAPAHVHAADELRDLIYRLHACSRDGPPAQVLDAVLEPSGYAVWLARLADGRERLERIDALRRLAQSGRRDTAAWLAELRLGEPVHDPAVGAERAKRDSGGTEDARDAGLARVMLTTVHAAKGKEWRVVFVAGAEEGLLPHARSLLEAGDGSNGSDQRAALADELRVAFVAVTRARDCLYLTYSRRRRRGDVLEPRQPSRFLRPVPAELFAADAADQRAA